MFNLPQVTWRGRLKKEWRKPLRSELPNLEKLSEFLNMHYRFSELKDLHSSVIFHFPNFKNETKRRFGQIHLMIPVMNFDPHCQPR